MNLEMDQKLVRAIARRALLYDIDHIFYKNNTHRKRLWIEISIEIDMPVEHCQKRWKRLRERFMHYERKRLMGTVCKPNMYSSLFEMMDFLKPVARDRMQLASTTTVAAPVDETPPPSNYCLRSFVAQSKADVEETCSNHSATTNSLDNLCTATLETITVPEPVSFNSVDDSAASAKIAEIIRWFKKPLKQYDNLALYCMSLASDLSQMDIAEQWRVRLEITKILSTAKYNTPSEAAE